MERVYTMSKTVYCEKCKRRIPYRGDLVTTTIFLEVVPYHEDCFANDLKGAKTLFVDNQPINGFSGNSTFLLCFILAFILLFFVDGPMKWLSILMIIPIIYRIYSYLKYERHLEK